MNKGFSSYFRRGWRASKLSFKGKSFKERVLALIYVLASFLGHLFIFTRPIYAIADRNLGDMVGNSFNFSLEKAYHGATKNEKYSQLLGAYVIRDLEVFLGLIIFLLPIGIYWTNYEIIYWSATAGAAAQMFGIIFTAMFAILALAFFVVMSLYYRPMEYIAKEACNFDSSDLLANSHRALGSKNKTTLFAIDFWYSLLIVVCIGVCVGIDFLANYLINKVPLAFQIYLKIGIVVLIFVEILVVANIIPNLVFGLFASETLFLRDVTPLSKTIVVKPVIGEAGVFNPLFVEKDMDQITKDTMEKTEE